MEIATSCWFPQNDGNILWNRPLVSFSYYAIFPLHTHCSVVCVPYHPVGPHWAQNLVHVGIPMYVGIIIGKDSILNVTSFYKSELKDQCKTVMSPLQRRYHSLTLVMDFYLMEISMLDMFQSWFAIEVFLWCFVLVLCVCEVLFYVCPPGFQQHPGPAYASTPIQAAGRGSHPNHTETTRDHINYISVMVVDKQQSLSWKTWEAIFLLESFTCQKHVCFTWRPSSWLNTLRPRQNGRHFPDDIFKWIFLNENVWISTKISLKFVPKVPINNIPALVQIMAWRRPGDKPLSEPMLVS